MPFANSDPPVAAPVPPDPRARAAPVEPGVPGRARPATAPRRGRKPAPPADTIARELRRRRELLRLSIREAAKRTGVSHTVIAKIERGKRLPTVRTFQRLRHGLGLDATPDILVGPAQPVEPLEVHLTRLATCLWASGGQAFLADLGAALGTSAAVVREQLPVLAPRVGACGLAVVTDGVEVRLEPLPVAASALEVMGRLVIHRRAATLSEEAMAVLAYVGWHEEVTRAEIDSFRGQESEPLLGRLVTAGLLDVVRDRDGRPANRYRLTTDALQAVGVASPEELRAKLRPLLGQCAPDPGSADDVHSARKEQAPHAESGSLRSHRRLGHPAHDQTAVPPSAILIARNPQDREAVAPHVYLVTAAAPADSWRRTARTRSAASFRGVAPTPNFTNRSRRSTRNRRASSCCSKPTMKSSAQRTMITSPRAWRRLHHPAHRSKTSWR
jgi:chromosome segregation and condensation protein ScpB/DNA-binding XRE family transcriptional regulator